MLSTKVIKEKIKDPYYHISFLAFLTALGVILNLTELFIPRPLPWIKFGFANIISLFLIIVAEIKDVFCVLFLRIILSSIFAGKLFGPGFILSISGGTLSTFVMIIVYKSLNKIFSLIGISILGAIIAAILVFPFIYFSTLIGKIIGERGVRILTRILGFFILAIGIQYILDGVVIFKSSI